MIMETTMPAAPQSSSKAARWAGYLLTALVAFFLLFDSVIKVLNLPNLRSMVISATPAVFA